MKKEVVHGTAVCIRDAAILLRGPSGAGKSDLAFRLMAMEAQLIGDDRVELVQQRGSIKIFPVQSIAGLLEVRGLGIVRSSFVSGVPLRLVVDLVEQNDVPRLPEPEKEDILGVSVPCLKLHAFEISAPLKVIKAIELAKDPDLLLE